VPISADLNFAIPLRISSWLYGNFNAIMDRILLFGFLLVAK
jgi:hypothetical protein